MNEQTSKLIEQLAAKLGTTADYLWAVLVRQAAIHSIINLIEFVVIIAIGFIIYPIITKFYRNNEFGYNIGPDMLVIITVGTWSILFVTCLFSINGIITGFLNPEYWALQEILDTLK